MTHVMIQNDAVKSGIKRLTEALDAAVLEPLRSRELCITDAGMPALLDELT
jgi:hypothetical protein